VVIDFWHCIIKQLTVTSNRAVKATGRVNGKGGMTKEHILFVLPHFLILIIWDERNS
jgi:hypothetical protein